MKSKQAVCFGEVLWDMLPSGKHLGGAPLNVALNLNNLGVETTMISAVGDDELGKQSRQVIREKGLSTDLIAYSSLPTGKVGVEIKEGGEADYTIHMPSAWDDISWHPSMQPVVKKADVLVFGTLALRNEISRNTLLKALQLCNGKAVVDVNFRKPFYDEILVDEVLTRADVAKINEDELRQILHWKQQDLSGAEALRFLADLFDLEMILLSRGAEGSSIWRKGEYLEKPAFPVDIKDTVGAGDAFLAGALYQHLQEKPATEILAFANAMGACVAARDGATPQLNPEEVEAMMKRG